MLECFNALQVNIVLNQHLIAQQLLVVAMANTVHWDQLRKFHASLATFKIHLVKVHANLVNHQTTVSSYTHYPVAQLHKVKFAQLATNVKIILCMLQLLAVLVTSKVELDKQLVLDAQLVTTVQNKLFLIQLYIHVLINFTVLLELLHQLFARMATYVQVLNLIHKKLRLNVLPDIIALQE